ncbi:AMP-binding protein [Rhodococcus sp. UNC23MFCrub1.1]|uniref:AMP-binding protein n=1 Tax=Rhodococcus sp. UNC23MFCrub1.1 TaxID=1449068 RepID=UPI0009DE3DCC|nr:AMP-binding protein [Rhodococcus sp. UNC23MFCrub1.1]
MQFATKDLTIGHVLESQAASFGCKPFLIFDDCRYSYAEVDRETNKIAHGLINLGIEHGDHTAIMLGNCPEILLSIFALGKIGSVSVPLNTSVRGKGLAYNLTHSDATTLIVDASLLPHVTAIIHLTPALQRIVTVGRLDASDDLPSGITVIEINDLITDNMDPPACTVEFKDCAFLMFTSGTTGPPKAVVYTHAYALTWAGGFADSYGYQSTDIMYVSMPLFHSNGLHAATYAGMLVGATVAVAARFSASNFWRDVKMYEATLTNLLGSMGDILWNLEPSDFETDNSLRQILAAPIPDRGRQMEQRWGVELVSCFGLTDYGVSNFSSVNDPPEKYGSCGKVSANFEVKVVDDDDFELPAGQLGEIVMRSRNPWHTASGYYKMPSETLNSVRNQWFHSGDLGVVDVDGFLYFKDRKKDAIRRRGENISAFEVEQVLMDHESIAEACVYAVDISGDQEVGASLIIKPGRDLEPAALVSWCEGRMSYFMVPRFVELRDEMPRTASGKLQKHWLRSHAQNNLDSLWDRVKEGVEVNRR